MTRAPKSRQEYRDAVLSEHGHGPSKSAARLVALALTADMDKNTLETYASVERIAKRSALSERTVRTALKTLVAEGWLKEHTKRRGRDYWLKIRRATLPARVAEIIAGTSGGELAATVSGTPARLPANGEATTGKKPHAEAVMVADDPVLEILKKNPGAASPSPADAGSAAQRRWSKDDVLARESAVSLEKESERRHVARAQAVDRLLRDGKSPEETAGELGEPLEFVLARKRLRDLNPFRKAKAMQ